VINGPPIFDAPNRAALARLHLSNELGNEVTGLSVDLTAATFSRWFLAAYFVLVAVFYTSRILAISIRTGRSPVSAGDRWSRHWVHHTIFRIFRSTILVVCVTRAIWPSLDQFLLPLSFLWQPALLIAGNVALVFSFAAILYVHFYMAQEWRSGIDGANDRPLIMTGPFALSRNPMFVLIQLGQLGLFLSLPSIFTLVCLVVGVLVIRSQVRLEEAYLQSRHGEQYMDYCSRVPRWFALTTSGFLPGP
jgi:protein-S-isoprenylcysteine O-methyltransferase Ste14